MALIKKCDICDSKGFRLKLTNGLCPKCADEFQDLENKYINLLEKLSTPSSNKRNLINDLEELVNHIPKFKTKENSSRIDNYENQLINLKKNLEVNTLSSPLSNSNIVEENLAEKENKPMDDFLENESFETLEDKVKETNKGSLIEFSKELPNIDEKPINTTEDSLEYIDNPLKDSITEIKEISIDSKVNSKKISENSLLETTTNSILEYKDLQAENPNVEKSETINLPVVENPNDSFKPIEDTINNPKTVESTFNDSETITNFYRKALAIVDLLEDYSISDNEMAENLFLLRDEVLPVLKKNHLTTVKDKNLDEFIASKMKILSLRTNQQENDLFNFFNYVAFSIQTTGIKAHLSDIIEISALKIRYGKVVDEFYTLINPNKSIKLLIEQRTGISNEDIKDAPPLYIALCDFINFTEKFKLISHNESFTSLFLNFNYNKILGVNIPNETACTMKLYRIRYKNYHGLPTEDFDIASCAKDLLTTSDIESIDNIKSPSSASALATYKLYEIIKYKYK